MKKIILLLVATTFLYNSSNTSLITALTARNTQPTKITTKNVEPAAATENSVKPQTAIENSGQAAAATAMSGQPVAVTASNAQPAANSAQPAAATANSSQPAAAAAAAANTQPAAPATNSPQPAPTPTVSKPAPPASDTRYSTWAAFENGSTAYWYKEMAKSYSGAVSNKYSHNGLPAYRIELRKDDPSVNASKRAEIAERTPEAAASDRTYQFSILLPNGGDEDYAIDPGGSEIIAQWHNTPDPGEEWTSPPLAIHAGAYENQADRYTLEWNWDAGAMSTNSTLKRSHYDLGSFLPDKGRWVDWKVRVKWGWLSSQNPVVQIYKDGVKIFELAGKPNTTNDQRGVSMKLGIYKWDWAQTGADNGSILSTRVIYYNNVSID